MIKSLIKKIKLINGGRYQFSKYYDKCCVIENEILFQSYGGANFSGNPYYLFRESCILSEYKKFKKYIAVVESAAADTDKLLKLKGYENYEIIIIGTKKYCKKLAECKYLINNAVFPYYFIKKKNQIYLNTWHGTPLKKLGKSITNEQHEFGNIQRNYLMTDFILFPNKFTYDKLREAYVFESYYTGKCLLGGYPRNQAFFDKTAEKNIRKKHGLLEKKIIVYMPTWRGKHSAVDKYNHTHIIEKMLEKIEKKLDENTILFAKLHTFTSSNIDFSKYNKILPFPTEYETYEFLNIADCLITDYSSVFFDFANSGKKIILYAYDKDEYLSTRGMYLDFNELPFSLVETLDELLCEMNNLDQYNKYCEKFAEFTELDHINAAKVTLQYLIDNKSSKNIKVIKSNSVNMKKNVMIYINKINEKSVCDGIQKYISTFNNNTHNYIFTFHKNSVINNIEFLNRFEKYDFFPILGKENLYFSECIYKILYYKFNFNNKYVKRKISKIYRRELMRIYPSVKIDTVVDFNGDNKIIQNVFSETDSKKMIFIQNRVIDKFKNRKIHIPTFNKYIRLCDKIYLLNNIEQNIFDSDIKYIVLDKDFKQSKNS